MRRWTLVGCALALGGCPEPVGGADPCPIELVQAVPDVAGSNIARVGDRVVWMQDNPPRIVLGAIDGSTSTTASIDGSLSGRGMAVRGDTVYWLDVLPGFTDSALFATGLDGITTTLATFPGCTAPSGLALDTQWWVGLADCGGEGHVRVGSGAVEAEDHVAPDLLDVAPGWALTGNDLLELDTGVTIPSPHLAPRRILDDGDRVLVVADTQLFAVPEAGGEAIELARNMIGAQDLVSDGRDAYVLTNRDGDPMIYRVPLDGSGDVIFPEVFARHAGFALAVDDDHVYFANATGARDAGIWRVEKCQ